MAEWASGRRARARLQLDRVFDAAVGREPVRQLVGEHISEFVEERLDCWILLGLRGRCVGRANHDGVHLFYLPPPVGAAKSLEREAGHARDHRLLGQALQRADESLHLGASGANGDGAAVPPDERIVGGEPRHAEDHVVALERGGGERSVVRDRVALGGGESAGRGDLSLGVDDGSIGEFDGA